MEMHHLVVPRTARYYTLGGGASALRSLWIACHGYGQLAAEFVAAFAPVAVPERRIVAPEAMSRFYLDAYDASSDTPRRVGATWMTREDREAEIDDQIGYLDALRAAVCADHPSDRVRLTVLGFSQGVATVGRWVARGTVRPDALVLWAGAFPPDIEIGPLAERLGQTPVTLVAGTRDRLAPWMAADAQLARFQDAGIAARLITFDGGHRLDRATLISIAAAE